MPSKLSLKRAGLTALVWIALFGASIVFYYHSHGTVSFATFLIAAVVTLAIASTMVISSPNASSSFATPLQQPTTHVPLLVRVLFGSAFIVLGLGVLFSVFLNDSLWILAPILLVAMVALFLLTRIYASVLRKFGESNLAGKMVRFQTDGLNRGIRRGIVLGLIGVLILAFLLWIKLSRGP